MSNFLQEYQLFIVLIIVLSIWLPFFMFLLKLDKKVNTLEQAIEESNLQDKI